MKRVPAGVSKRTGKPYRAFYSCNDRNCNTTVREDDVKMAPEERFKEELRDSNIQMAVQAKQTMHKEVMNMAQEKQASIEIAHKENIRATALEAACRMGAAKLQVKGEQVDILSLANDYLAFIESDHFQETPGEEPPPDFLQ